jgi:tRNA dimethylallyltransferase
MGAGDAEVERVIVSTSIRLPLVVLVGPTAVGKSSVALALAERVAGEIVAADSMQVYRGLDIGTAKADPEARWRIPHHLMDVVDPDESFTAFDYAKLARATVCTVRERARVPIVVAGTGLYLRALLRGLFEGPGETRSIRVALRRTAEDAGTQTLHARLRALDPESAAVIHPNDLFRIVRALEVLIVTGRPMSVLREDGRRHHAPIPGPILRVGLVCARDELYRRIDERVEQMLARGFVEEVWGLLNRGHSPALRPLRAIGYRHLIGYLQGALAFEDAVADWKRDTRRYAKRQLTWFRHEDGVEWHGAEGPGWVDAAADQLAERIKGECTRAV